MRARIRNIVGVEHADLPLDPGVLLIAGLNGAGKTTILQALASAATGEWRMRGIDKRKDMALLVRSGATEGVILLEYPGGSVRIAYPAGTVEQQGKAPEIGTALGMGVQRFMALPPEKRLAEMQARFKTAPTREDFCRWWREHPLPGMDPDAPADSPARRAVDVLWADIDESGWEAIAKREAGKVNMVQGRWAEATGARWGTRQRLEWAPVGLHRGEEYSLEDAAQAIRKAKGHLDDLLSVAAVDGAKRAELRAQVGRLPELRTQMAMVRDRIAGLEREIDGIVEAMERDGEPIDPRRFPICPHCQGALLVRQERGVGVVVEKAPPGLSIEAYEKAVQLRGSLAATRQAKRAEADECRAQEAVLAANIAAGEVAERRLVEIADVPDVPADEIAAARLAVAEAEDFRDRVRRLHRAIELNAEWELAVQVRDAVAADGIRGEVLARRTSEITMELAAVSASAGMGEIRLDPEDAAVWYENRPYAMLSESEQWRADFLMALVLANREGAKLFLVDRLDLLHPQARPAVLKALAKMRIPCVVGMTAREPKPPAMPDLEAAKIGRSVWLGGGKLEVKAP
jgi:hypothetical protein